VLCRRVAQFARQPEIIHPSEIASHGLANWVRAMGLFLFAFGGWEDSLLPAGEIKEPRRTIPFGLGIGLLGCALIFMLLQFIVVATIGTGKADAPLSATASALLGRSGAGFVAIAALVSVYGWISGKHAVCTATRLLSVLAGRLSGYIRETTPTVSHTDSRDPVLCRDRVGTGIERHFPLARGTHFRHSNGFVRGRVRLARPSS